MNIYLAGPMTGYPSDNAPAFAVAAAELRAQGYFVFNPAEANPPTPVGVARHYRTCMAVDLAWICAHADAIAMLPGWEASNGVRAELALAKAIGLTIIELGTADDPMAEFHKFERLAK